MSLTKKQIKEWNREMVKIWLNDRGINDYGGSVSVEKVIDLFLELKLLVH